MYNLSTPSGVPGRIILLCLSSLGLMCAQPLIHFSDLESGPNTGGQDNQGAFVSIYGARFGASRGGSNVTVGGQPVANYPVWTDTKVTFQLGAAAASGEIKINTSGGTSAGLPFTVRPGNIYFVSPSGSNTAAGTFAAPWRTVQKAVDTIAPGDAIYVLNGLVETRVGTSDGSVTISRNFGEAGRPKALIGYPGAVATIGSIGPGPCTSTACIEGIKTSYASNYWTIANLKLLGNDYGLVVRGTDWRVIGNEFTCPNGNGASACLDGSNAVRVKVFGNNIHDTGFDRSSALYHGIYFSTDSNLLDIGWNSLTNVKGCRGIQIHSSRQEAGTGLNQYGIDIHDNFIKDTQCDAIVLATIDPSKGAIRIFNNVIVNGGRGPVTVEGGGNYACIYVAGYTNNGPQGSGVVDIYNNTMVNCGTNRQIGWGGVTYARRATTIDVRMRNNIMVQPAGIPYLVNYDSTTGFTGSNNLFFGNGTLPATFGLGGTLNADPKLASPASDNYHLASGSPAIGAGVNTGLTLDKDGLLRGTPPDVGAYQFTAATAPPPPAPQPAVLSLSPATVSATGTAGGATPTAQPVVLSNVAGGSTAAWSLSSNQPWVTVTPASGSLAGGANQPLSVIFNTAGMPAGSHSATVSFTGGSTPPSLQVQLNLSAPVTGPMLTLTPASLSGSYTTGGTALAAKTVTLKNDGGSTASWSAVPAQSWLSVSPASGSLAAGASMSLTVNAAPASLGAGSYPGVINVSGGTAARSITYALTVVAAPPPPPPTTTTLSAAPAVLGFVGLAGREVRPRTLVITNTGGATANWNVLSSTPWLRMNPASGTLAAGASATVTVTAVTTGLNAGAFLGSIVVSGGASPIRIIVKLTLGSAVAELRRDGAPHQATALAWLRPRERRTMLTPFAA